MSRFAIALPRSLFGVALLAGIGMLAPALAQADQLLVERVQQEAHMDLPARGMSMAQVEHRFGAPQHKLSPRGGDTALHPLIHRWEYSGYIVYFERSHVIHAVLNTPAGNNMHPASAH